MNSNEEKISYIIGRQVGEGLIGQGVELTFESFLKGVESIYSKSDSEVSMTETQELMTAYQEKHVSEETLEGMTGKARPGGRDKPVRDVLAWFGKDYFLRRPKFDRTMPSRQFAIAARNF